MKNTKTDLKYLFQNHFCRWSDFFVS